MRSEFPHVSALRSKKKVQLAILVRFSDVHIYTYVYIYIYDYIATYSYRGDSLT